MEWKIEEVKKYIIIELLENVKTSQTSNYKSTIFLVNREILKKLNMDSCAKDLAKLLNHSENKFFDVSNESFLEIVDWFF